MGASGSRPCLSSVMEAPDRLLSFTLRTCYHGPHAPSQRHTSLSATSLARSAPNSCPGDHAGSNPPCCWTWRLSWSTSSWQDFP